jgi:hypothetical protein
MDRVISREFAAYEESGITREMVDETERSTEAGWTWARYRVIQQKVYGPPGPARQTLEYLIRHFRLPDLDFVYLMGDGIQNPVSFPGPALCSAKRKGLKNVVLFHDWYFYIFGSFRGPQFDWTHVCQEISALSEKTPWEEKIGKGFWRGATTDAGGPWGWTKESWKEGPRGRSVYLSGLYPEFLNSGYVESNPAMREKILALAQTDLPLMKNQASYEEHLRYKYQLCIDGVTCTSPGYQWRLLSNCCVFKQETPQVMWFYSELIPWVHYVPLREDLSDLMEKLAWAREHDDEARRIAENGTAFAREHLLPEEILLYAYKLLVKYASLQRF